MLADTTTYAAYDQAFEHMLAQKQPLGVYGADGGPLRAYWYCWMKDGSHGTYSTDVQGQHWAIALLPQYLVDFKVPPLGYGHSFTVDVGLAGGLHP